MGVFLCLSKWTTLYTGSIDDGQSLLDSIAGIYW